MSLHPSTFEYLSPTAAQKAKMERLRLAAKEYASVIDSELPDGPDKTFILRSHRTTAMWTNVACTRQADGAPLPE